MTLLDARPVFTLTSTPHVLRSREEAVDAAKALKAPLRERLPLGQELRRLPDENVVDLLESGLVGLMKPKRYGGSELGAEALIDVTIELASADPSTGWVYMLWSTHMWMQALWPVQAMDEMFANPNNLASSITATMGDVNEVPGGYTWTGKGLFSSGVDHCDWLTAAVPVKRDGVDINERRWLLIPRSDFEIVDDWRTVGLRGTGSKTIVVDNIFVPTYRTLRSEDVENGTGPGRAVNTHPMYSATPNLTFMAAMAAPAIGAARGLLEETLAKLRAKANSAVATTNNPYAESGQTTLMARISHVGAQLDALHALMLIDAQRFGEKPAAEVTNEERERTRRNRPFIAQQARRAANMLFEEAGGSGLLEHSILQQLWRDANGAAAHHGLTWDWLGARWPEEVLKL